MKITILFLCCFVLVNCQRTLNSYLNSKFLNPLMQGPWRAFDAPLPRFAFFGYPQHVNLQFQQPAMHDWQQMKNEEALTLGGGGVSIEEATLMRNSEGNGGRFLLGLGNAGFGGNSNAAVGPIFLRTYIFTSVVTSTIPSISRCIPSAQFSQGATNTPCLRRKREIAEFLDGLVLSDESDEQFSELRSADISPVLKVGPTVTASTQNSHTLSSSKHEGTGPEFGTDSSLARSKRFFNVFAVTTTITSTSLVPSVVTKQVNVVSATVANAGNCVQNAGVGPHSCLICRPEGYGIC